MLGFWYKLIEAIYNQLPQPYKLPGKLSSFAPLAVFLSFTTSFYLFLHQLLPGATVFHECFCCKHQKNMTNTKTKSLFFSNKQRLDVISFAKKKKKKVNLNFSGLFFVFLRCWWSLALCLYLKVRHLMADWKRALRALGLIWGSKGLVPSFQFFLSEKRKTSQKLLANFLPKVSLARMCHMPVPVAREAGDMNFSAFIERTKEPTLSTPNLIKPFTFSPHFKPGLFLGGQ